MATQRASRRRLLLLGGGDQLGLRLGHRVAGAQLVASLVVPRVLGADQDGEQRGGDRQGRQRRDRGPDRDQHEQEGGGDRFVAVPGVPLPVAEGDQAEQVYGDP